MLSQMMMDSILARIEATGPSRDTSLLQELVGTLRPRHASDLQQATNRLRALAHLLATRPEWAHALREYVRCQDLARAITVQTGLHRKLRQHFGRGHVLTIGEIGAQ